MARGSWGNRKSKIENRESGESRTQSHNITRPSLQCTTTTRVERHQVRQDQPAIPPGPFHPCALAIHHPLIPIHRTFFFHSWGWRIVIRSVLLKPEARSCKPLSPCLDLLVFFFCSFLLIKLIFLRGAGRRRIVVLGGRSRRGPEEPRGRTRGQS